MKGQRPIFWYQGLFLQPQHFQLLDVLQAARVLPVQEYSRPCFFGAGRLRIQEAALGSRQFEVAEAELLFPDGSHVVFPGNAIIKPRSFDKAWQRAERPFKVFLGLRKWNPAAENVTVVPSPDEMAGATTRFAATNEPEDAVDLHGGGAQAKVRRLTQVVRVFWETEQEQLDNYTFLEAAELVRDGDSVRLSDRFAPPALTLSAAPALQKCLRSIRDQVASRCQQLEEYKDPKEVQPMTLALLALNRQVPVLSQLCETPEVAPWTAYLLLRQAAGELSTFSNVMDAGGCNREGEVLLPPYDHRDAGTCFAAAEEWISRLLDSILAGPEHVIKLKLDGQFFTGTVPQEMQDRRNRFWLVLQTETDAERVAGEVATVAKLGTLKSLPAIIARGVSGIPLSHHPGVPQGLPQRAHTQYFQIDTRHRLWAEVAQAESIAFYWSNAPHDLKAEIIIIKE